MNFQILPPPPKKFCVRPWMAPLYSHTDLVGPLLKWRSRLSRTNRRYELKLVSHTRTKLEKPIKWMEASSFSSSKERSPYTMSSEGDVHYGVWHWWDNTTPRYTYKAEGKYCLLVHIPVPPLSSCVQEKNDYTWLYTTPSFFMTAQRVTPLLLSRSSCAAGNGILEHPAYSPYRTPCDYELFAKVVVGFYDIFLTF